MTVEIGDVDTVVHVKFRPVATNVFETDDLKIDVKLVSK